MLDRDRDRVRGYMPSYFAMSSNKIKSTLSKYMTDNKSKYIMIAEKTPIDYSNFDKSDLIFIFNKEGKLALLTERIHKKNYNWIQWKLLLKKARGNVKIVFNSKLEPDIQVSYTIHSDYVDITYYKQWWYEWAKSLSAQ